MVNTIAFTFSIAILTHIAAYAAVTLKDISVGGVHVVATLDNQSLYVWGANHFAQLGTGNDKSQQSPYKSAMSQAIVQIAAKRDHSCLLLDDNSVRCWGDNSSGQLGLGSAAGMVGGTTPEALEKLPALNLGSDPTQKLILGYTHTCLLTQKGQLKCFGSNLNGALGIGKTVPSVGSSPGDMGQALATALVGDTAVSDGCAGRAFTCALLETGSVKCWGTSKAAGNGTDKNLGSSAPEMGNTLLPVELGERATKLACGEQSVCAVLESGAVKCWGKNLAGVLGVGLPEWKPPPYPDDPKMIIGDAPNEMGAALLTVPIEPGLRAMDISCGSSHCCAVLENSAVKCWGGNNSGQLGLGDDKPRGLSLSEMGSHLPYVDLGNNYEAEFVRLGSITSCAGLKTGDVKCWGGGTYGQLGLGAPFSAIGIYPQQMGESLKSLVFE